MIPVSLKNQIDSEVRACIVEEGEDPEKCISRTAKIYGLNEEQTQEIADNLLEYEEE
jgi:hypothetical protein